jgi:hypothetical protein
LKQPFAASIHEASLHAARSGGNSRPAEAHDDEGIHHQRSTAVGLRIVIDELFTTGCRECGNSLMQACQSAGVGVALPRRN